MKLELDIQNPYPSGRYAWAWENVLSDDSVLDYGCNDGKVLSRLRSNSNANRIGVDLCADAIEKGQEIYPNLTLEILCNTKGVSVSDGTFDKVLLLDVIEHVADQKAILSELRRVIKPTGQLILTVPGKHLFSFLDLGNWKFYFPRLHRWAYIHRHGRDVYEYRYGESNPFGLIGDIEREKGIHEHFTRKSLAALLRDSEFEVVAFDGTGYFQRLISILNFVLPIHSFWKALQRWDQVRFSTTNLFVLCNPI